MSAYDNLVNSIRSRLADGASLPLFEGLVSGSEYEFGRAVAEYFRAAPAQLRDDSPELFEIMEKAPVSGLDRDFYRGLGCRPEPFTDIWRCGFDSGILRLSEDGFFVDGGAEDLFSSQRFARLAHGKYRGIAAFEPAPGNYAVCLANRGLFDERLRLFPLALAEETGLRRFAERGPDSRLEPEGDCEVRCIRLDEALYGERPTLIKLHLEGGELPAILGAEGLIRACSPQLAVCLHRPADVLDIPVKLLEFCPGYRFCLRHYSSSITETVLYALPDK